MDDKKTLNLNIKSIWPRKDPFEIKKQPKLENEKEVLKKEENINTVVSDKGNENIEELKAKGKVPTEIKITDCTGGAEGNMLKLMVTVRNCGDALARDVKIKCIGNARLTPLTSPMTTCGDVFSNAKAVGQFAFLMPENFCEEYANFSLVAEAENAKTYSQLFTLKTGRRPLSASEILEKEQGKKPEGKH